MSSVFAPFGFRPAYSFEGTIRPSEFPDAIVSGFGTQIFVNQPVKLVNGSFQPITAAADKTIGVFMGVEFFQNNNATTKGGSTGWPAGQTYQAGTMKVTVMDLSDLVYEVMADGPVLATALYSIVNTTNIAGGNINIGQSGASVSRTTVGVGNTGQWLIVGVQQGPDNSWGDPFTVVRVIQANSQVYGSLISIG